MALGLVAGLKAAKGLGSVITGGIKAVVGDKAQLQEMDATRNTTAVAQFAAEFRQQDRFWEDRLFDAINRIPRPLFAFMVAYYFYWVASESKDVDEFLVRMLNTPAWMQYTMGSVIGFFYGFRQLEKHYSRRTRKQDRDTVLTHAAAQDARDAQGQTSAVVDNDAEGDIDDVIVNDAEAELTNLQKAQKRKAIANGEKWRD